MISAAQARSQFRSTHAPRCVEIARTRWEYWPGGHRPHGLLVLGDTLSFGDTHHRLITQFEGSRRVLAPTYPQVDSVSRIIDGLISLLDFEQLTAVDVIGHGFGAGLAHLLARRHPARVDRVVLSGFGLLTSLRIAALRARFGRLDTAWPGLLREHLRTELSGQRDAGGSAEARAFADDLMVQHPPESALHRAKLFQDLWRSQSALYDPSPAHALLLFPSSEAFFTTREQRLLQRTYEQPEVVRFDGGGQLLGVFPAEAQERALDGFLRGSASPRVRFAEPVLLAG